MLYGLTPSSICAVHLVFESADFSKFELVHSGATVRDTVHDALDTADIVCDF